jgi:excisionase family DNA binding protein
MKSQSTCEEFMNDDHDNNHNLMSEKQAAARLGISRITLLRAREAGRIRCFRIGTRVLTRKDHYANLAELRPIHHSKCTFEVLLEGKLEGKVRRAAMGRSPFARFLQEMAPQVGLEPTTLRLTAECSAIELLRNNCGCTAINLVLSRNGFYNKRDPTWSRRGLSRVLP